MIVYFSLKLQRIGVTTMVVVERRSNMNKMMAQPFSVSTFSKLVRGIIRYLRKCLHRLSK